MVTLKELQKFMGQVEEPVDGIVTYCTNLNPLDKLQEESHYLNKFFCSLPQVI